MECLNWLHVFAFLNRCRHRAFELRIEIYLCFSGPAEFRILDDAGGAGGHGKSKDGIPDGCPPVEANAAGPTGP